MQSELDILKARGLSPKPENAKPAPPEAAALSRRYYAGLRNLKQCVAKIRAQCDPDADVDVAWETLRRLFGEAANAAAQVRDRALSLASFPTCWLDLGSGIAYFGAIAGAAEEAYQGTMDELDRLEAALGNRGTPRESFRLLDLGSHEGYKRGHLGEKHVAKTMADFKQRWLEEEKRGRTPPILSSFIGDSSLGVRDPRIQRTVSRAIHLAKGRIEQADDGDPVWIPINELRDIGYVKRRGKPPQFTKSGRILVYKDKDHADGFRIHTVELGEQEP